VRFTDLVKFVFGVFVRVHCEKILFYFRMASDSFEDCLCKRFCYVYRINFAFYSNLSVKPNGGVFLGDDACVNRSERTVHVRTSLI
jgi:hypothetical protein